MRNTRWAVVLAALAVGACSSNDEPAPGPDPYVALLAGEWTTACVREPGTEPDYMEVMTFGGASAAVETRTYATHDGICVGGPATEAVTTAFSLGGEVAATIGVGGRAVTARAVDVTLPTVPPEVFYSLVYVDTAPDPDVLYLGDDTVDPARDGTTAAKRPVVLEDWKPLTRPPLPTDPFLATLAGTWATGCVREPGSDPDYVETMTFGGTSVAAGTWTYETLDGTCGGTPATETRALAFGVGGEVTATIGTGGTAVTARRLDLDLSGVGGGILYTLVYVDTAADPDVLRLGDESADPALDGSTAALRPVVLQDRKASTRQ